MHFYYASFKSYYGHGVTFVIFKTWWHYFYTWHIMSQLVILFNELWPLFPELGTVGAIISWVNDQIIESLINITLQKNKLCKKINKPSIGFLIVSDNYLTINWKQCLLSVVCKVSLNGRLELGKKFIMQIGLVETIIKQVASCQCSCAVNYFWTLVRPITTVNQWHSHQNLTYCQTWGLLDNDRCSHN